MISIGIQSLIRFSTVLQTKHHHHHHIHHVLFPTTTTTTTTTTTVVRTTVTSSLLPAPVPPQPRSPSGDTDVPRPLPQNIQAARPLFVVQPLRLLAFHLLLLLATYLPLEPRTALIIVRLLSALQVISVVDGLFRYLRRTN
jgi:hypothetical protein